MKSIELVISHHNESLDWIVQVQHLVKSIVIYYKGNRPTDAPVGCTLTPLPNVGREAHTYLTHMNKIKREPSPVPPDFYVFTMGSVKENVEKWNTLLHILRCQPYFSRIAYVYPTEYHMQNFQNFTLEEYKQQKQYPAVVRPLKAWFNAYFPTVPWCPQKATFVGSIFAASAEQIKQYDFYEQLLVQSSVSESTEVAHFLERVWKMMFDQEPFVRS